MSKISEMSLLGRWLGKKKPERTDRVTRSLASPSTARVSYNEEVVPLELLEETSPAWAITFLCPDFLDAGIREEFESLCANAGLTRLATCRVTQYRTLTSCFINSFRYNPDADTIEFRICSELLTMSMEIFCEAIGVSNAGKKVKMNSQPTELRTLFDSLCNQDMKDLQLKLEMVNHYPHPHG